MFHKVISISLLAVIIVLALPLHAFAHVVVKPSTAVTSDFQSFSVGVPNEKEVPTIAVRILLPEGLKYVTPNVKPGWQIDVEKLGEGESAVAKSITWSGGSIGEGLRDDFTFSAQTPANEMRLQWKAYQTYENGTIVSWDKASTGSGHDEMDEDSGPLSVTAVTKTSVAENTSKEAERQVADAKASADRAFYIGLAAFVVSLGTVFYVVRKS